LLAGSMLVFGLLATLMIVTRRVNWFDLEKAARAAPGLSAAP
jgi:inner membrane protein involved in colicin E2 resistance